MNDSVLLDSPNQKTQGMRVNCRIAIQKAIDNPVDPETAHAVAEKFTSVTAFAHRIESAVLSR